MTDLLKKSLVFIAILTAPQLFAQSYQDGMTAMQLAKWDDAIEAFTAVTKADPENQDAWLSLGSAYMAKGDKEAAQKASEGLLASNSGGARGFIANGRIAMLKGDAPVMDKQLERAKRAGRKDATVWRHLGESFLYVGKDEKPQFEKAQEYLKKGYTTNPKDFDVLMTIGYAYKIQGRGGDAAQYYEIASMLQPNNPLPNYLLGRVYYIAKLYPKAVDYYDKAIAADPSYDRALRAKAEYLYFDAKEHKNAAETYKMLVNNGKNVTIEDEMGYANTLFLVRDYKACIEQVQKVINIDPTKTYLRRLLGYCYFENGEYQKGLDVMNDYFAKEDEDKVLPSDYLYLANLQLNVGMDTLEPIKNFKKMIEMDPTRWETWKQIGDLHYKRKEYCEANNAYRMRLDSLGDNAAATDHYFIGLTDYFCQDNPDSIRYTRAKDAFEKVAELAPESGTGWLWAGKAASKLDPDLQADTTQAAADAFGKAEIYFEKYIEITDAEPEKNKKNRITSLEYIVYYHYVKEEFEDCLKYIEKLLALEPEDPTGLELRRAIYESMGIEQPDDEGEGK